MELTLRHCIFCDSVVPLPDNKIVCYGIFDEIRTKAFPFFFPHFCILCAWTNGKGFHIQQTKLLNPSRTIIISQSPEQYFTLEDEAETAYVTIDVNQIVFTEPGGYILQIYIHGKLAEEIPLFFSKI